LESGEKKRMGARGTEKSKKKPVMGKESFWPKRLLSSGKEEGHLTRLHVMRGKRGGHKGGPGNAGQNRES